MSIGIMLGNDLQSMCSFLALGELGATPLSLKPSNDLQLNRETTARLAKRFEIHGVVGVPGVASPDDVSFLSAPIPTEQGLAFVQFTSGTTTDPKPIPVTDKMLAANLDAIIAYNDFDPERVALNSLPLSHDFGLVGAFLTGIHQRHTTIMLEPLYVYAAPHKYLALIEELSVTSVSQTNTSLRHLVSHLDRRPTTADLSSLSNITLGAEPIEEAVVTNAFNKLRENGVLEHAFSFGYGMAEVVLFATGHKVESLASAFVDHPGHPGRRIAKLGKSSFGVETKLEAGSVCLRGDSVFAGYWMDHPRAGEWYHSSDRGVLADGELAVLGRADDCVIVNGRNIYLNDVESILSEAFPREQIVAVEDGGISLLLVYSGRSSLDEGLTKRIQEVMVRRFDVRAANIEPIHRRSLVYSTSGKVNRLRTSQLLVTPR